MREDLGQRPTIGCEGDGTHVLENAQRVIGIITKPGVNVVPPPEGCLEDYFNSLKGSEQLAFGD